MKNEEPRRRVALAAKRRPPKKRVVHVHECRHHAAQVVEDELAEDAAHQ